MKGNSNRRDQGTNVGRGEKETKKQNTSARQMDDLQREADNDSRTRKPGSQSNSSKQHNNGRGGGK